MRTIACVVANATGGGGGGLSEVLAFSMYMQYMCCNNCNCKKTTTNAATTAEKYSNCCGDMSTKESDQQQNNNKKSWIFSFSELPSASSLPSNRARNKFIHSHSTNSKHASKSQEECTKIHTRRRCSPVQFGAEISKSVGSDRRYVYVSFCLLLLACCCSANWNHVPPS